MGWGDECEQKVITPVGGEARKSIPDANTKKVVRKEGMTIQVKAKVSER
jgi:hypothetical protein